MNKLVKKNGLGGIAESVDSALDGLGTWGKLGVQVLDPTGITGWKDFADTLKVFQKEGGLKNAGMLTLSALGAVPVVGAFKGMGKTVAKLGKAGKAKKLKAASKALLKELTNIAEDCIQSGVISDINRTKILELSKKVDSIENTTNSADTIFKYITDQLTPTMRIGGRVMYKYF